MHGTVRFLCEYRKGLSLEPMQIAEFAQFKRAFHRQLAWDCVRLVEAGTLIMWATGVVAYLYGALVIRQGNVINHRSLLKPNWRTLFNGWA